MLSGLFRRTSFMNWFWGKTWQSWPQLLVHYEYLTNGKVHSKWWTSTKCDCTSHNLLIREIVDTLIFLLFSEVVLTIDRMYICLSLFDNTCRLSQQSFWTWNSISFRDLVSWASWLIEFVDSGRGILRFGSCHWNRLRRAHSAFAIDVFRIPIASSVYLPTYTEIC